MNILLGSKTSQELHNIYKEQYTYIKYNKEKFDYTILKLIYQETWSYKNPDEQRPDCFKLFYVECTLTNPPITNINKPNLNKLYLLVNVFIYIYPYLNRISWKYSYYAFCTLACFSYNVNFMRYEYVREV
jgi:hypothetical protein